MEEDVVEEYRSALSDLNCNSKPLINMLTMLAEENVKQAPKIVQVIETHLQRVSPEVKLPVMYLIDSIIKNVGKAYLQLFTQNIVSDFCSVFEKVDEKTRMQLFKLRQTWSEVFPSKKMYAIDLRVQAIDPAWPVVKPTQPNIHFNPKFLEGKAPPQQPQAVVATPTPVPTPPNLAIASTNEDEVQHEMRQQLIAKQAELLRLKQQKLELDLLRLREQTQSLQVNKQGPLQQQSITKDPRLTRRDPRTLGNPRVSFRDPRLVSRPAIQTIMPNTPVIPVEPVPKERIVMARTNLQQKPIEVPKLILTTKLDAPKRDVLLSSKDNKALQGNHKPPPPVSSSKESSQQDKLPETKSSEKSPPKSKLQSVVKSPNSKTKEKSLPDISELTIPKINKVVIESSNVEEKSISAPSVDKNTSSPDKKEDKRRDSKKRSPKSPSKKENKKQRDQSPNKKSNKKSSPENKKAKSISSTASTNVHKSDQVQDVDLRVLPPSGNKKSVVMPENNKEVKEHKSKNEEPPSKKAKIDEKVDSLFGGEDQDYRLIPAQFSEDEDDIEEIESPARIRQKNWAQYKAAHPDEFKSPLRPAKENIYGETDKDFRIMPFVGRQDGFDRLGRPILSRMGMERRPSIQEGHEELPSEEQDLLMLSKEQEILREAHQQLQARLITQHDHQLVIDRFRALRSRFPKGPVWLNNERILQPRLENGMISLPEDACPNMANRLPPSKPILIDGKMRHIKFFGERAIVYMDDNKPYQITFTGTPTSFSIDGQELFFMAFGETREFTLNGRQHQVKFGSPSREVYVDCVPYAATFGGEPIPIVLGGVVHQIKLGGPQPNVELSSNPVQDLHETQKAPPTREELLDVDMRDSFLQRVKSPESKEVNSPESQDEKLEDVDMRVPIGVPLQPSSRSQSPKAQNSPLREPPNPDKLLAFMQEQEKNKSAGESWNSGRAQRDSQRPESGPEWRNATQEPAPVRGPTDMVAGTPKDWQPPQQVPMDWESTGQEKERRLKFQTFHPEDGPWRDSKKERDWEWRQGFSNSNSPQRFEEFTSKTLEQDTSRSGPAHPHHLQAPPHPGLLQGSHLSPHNDNLPQHDRIHNIPQQELVPHHLEPQIDRRYRDPHESRLHPGPHMTERALVDHHHGLPPDRLHLGPSNIMDRPLPGPHMDMDRQLQGHHQDNIRTAGPHQERLRQEMHVLNNLSPFC